MKVLLVNGSPHKEGCTYTGLVEIQEELKRCGVDSDIFWIGNKPIRGCVACRRCRELGHCVFDDDIVNRFLEIAGDYDGYVFGDPVHWGAMSGAMTCFMDRVFYADVQNGTGRFHMKPAAAVVSARRAGTVSTWDQVNRYFALMQMPIVTSRYWTVIHGAKAEEVKEDPEGLQSLRILARNMAYMIRAFKAAKEAGIDKPVQEAPVFTNFVR